MRIPGSAPGQDHARQGLRPGGAQGQAGVAEIARDGPERLLGRDDDHRQRQDRQRQGGPEERRLAEAEDAGIREQPIQAPAHELDEEAEPEEAEDDRGHPSQVGHRHPDRLRQPGAGWGVLVQVDGGGHAHRQHRHGHEQRQDGGAVDGGEDPAGGHSLLGRRGEEAPADAPGAAHHHVPEDDPQHGDDQERGRAGEPGEATTQQLAARDAHAAAPDMRRTSRRTTSAATELSTKVKRNSSTPMKNSTA